MPEFAAEFFLPESPEVVFEFHAATANLLRMIPQDANPVLVEGPPRLSAGAEFELKVSTFGMSQQLRFKVLAFEPPHKLVVAQLKGPFRAWQETHRFDPAASPAEGTRLSYRVEFEPPGGMLGFVVTAPRVIEQLAKLWPYREQRTRELLAGK